MSMKNATTSQKTLLGRVLSALFGTDTKVSAEIPNIPNFTGHNGYGNAPNGYHSRSSQKKRRKMERKVGIK